MKFWLLALFFVATGAVADIGSVTDIKGTALIRRGKENISVVKGTSIEINDRVEAKNGVVTITFKDDTTAKVTENSSLVIDDFVYDPKNKSGKLALKAAEGTIRYVSGNIAHNNPNSVNIKTPTAAIAVRGTDFIMAVDETGKSLVVLMPSCESPMGINLSGKVCGSGKIDVQTGLGTVTMNRPYEATIVETGSTAPTLPVVVDLSNTPIGNNLIIRPPTTIGGTRITSAAKAAAEKTGDTKHDDSKSSGEPSVAETTTAQKSNTSSTTSHSSESSGGIDVNKLREQGITVNDIASGDTHVFRLYRDNNSNLNQIGWLYQSLNAAQNNLTNITLPLGTRILVIVGQDRITDAYNFNANSSKAYGSITIQQNYR